MMNDNIGWQHNPLPAETHQCADCRRIIPTTRRLCPACERLWRHEQYGE